MGTRQYRSPLRAAYSEETGERIVVAALEYLEKNEADTMTLPRVAKVAGVSPPTVYAHFPTLDDLYQGIFQWLQPRIGLLLGAYPADVDALADLPAKHFPAYEKHSRALRALLLAPGFHRARATRRTDRHQAWVEVAAAATPGLSPKEQRLATYAVNAFWTPSVWNWLIGTCGLTTEEAVKTASWAIRTLVDALKKDPSGLRDGPVEQDGPPERIRPVEIVGKHREKRKERQK